MPVTCRHHWDRAYPMHAYPYRACTCGLDAALNGGPDAG